MPTLAVVLMTVFALELITMVVSMAYVFCLTLKKNVYFNEHLKGRRLLVASILPFIWFIYTYSEAYTVYYAGESVKWDIEDGALKLKIITQILSLIGGLILALFVTGYKFGDK